jgi:maleate cis-trans isomerase
MSDHVPNYSVTYGGYAFTVGEMHAEIRSRREEAKRVPEIGEAALDLNKLQKTDLKRVVAIGDYYDLVWTPSQVGLAR